jgi:glutamyl-tRNA synthetase
MKVRTRFAPSPTGHLHIGGARTALFNYLYARHHGGEFVLRIEDTDKERSEQQYVDAILGGLAWLGLSWDEGPHYQSQRIARHHEVCEQLLSAGKAYWCFCKPEEIEAKREAAQAKGGRWVYDRTCRRLGKRPAPGEKAVLRFASPTDGDTVVRDLVRGSVAFPNAELDDLILLRSDGSPTFHLVVVTDDMDMGITHILRGEDHLTNTPRQIQIFRALDAEPPRYGHMPLIVGADRARLSKRHGATSVVAYREQGYLPQAMLNYLARLGWSHGDQEIFTLAELVEHFDIDGVNKAASAFDLEKLAWVNSQHLKACSAPELATAVAPILEARGHVLADHRRLEPIVVLFQERARLLSEVADGCEYFLADEIRYDGAAVAKFLNEEAAGRLDVLIAELESVEPWEHDPIHAAFERAMERLELKLGKLAQPVRVALTGGTASPGIFEVCEVLGREKTLARLRDAIARGPGGELPLRPVESE